MVNCSVECIANTDFTKGFANYHVKWPIAILKVDKDSALRSQDFGISPKIGCRWWLSVCRYKNKACILLLPKYGKLVPIVVRFAICIGNKEAVYSKSMFTRFGIFEIEMELPIGDDDFGDSILHCWIDIPNSFLDNHRKRKQFDDHDQLDSFEQRCVNDLSTNFNDLFEGVTGENEEFASLSDVTLVILDKKIEKRRFFGHRCVLAARSAVFLRMFANREWKENEGERIIEIKDIDEEIMEHIFKFIYTGCVPDDINEDDETLAHNLIYAADKYGLDGLKKWCASQFILEELKSDDDCIDQLELAERHHLDQLKAVCIDCLSTNISILKEKKFREKISDESYSALVDACTKRQVSMKEMTIITKIDA